jgi:Protein of unknown function (DUF3750)
MNTKIILIFFCIVMSTACAHKDWRTAHRSSVGLAPLPDQEPRAVVQVYAARAINWRGYFVVHSWIAVKPKDAGQYTTYHVMGFRIKRTGSAVVIEQEIPDRRWFGAEPMLIADLRGEKAEAAIPKIQAAAESYKYQAAAIFSVKQKAVRAYNFHFLVHLALKTRQCLINTHLLYNRILSSF